MARQFSSKTSEKIQFRRSSGVQRSSLLVPAIKQPTVPILQLQKKLGNQKVGGLIRAKRLASRDRRLDGLVAFNGHAGLCNVDRHENRINGAIGRLAHVPHPAMTARIQRQLIPPELRTSANVRGMTEKALQERYDLLVQTMKLMST